jgi:hypothetical protein
MDFRAKVVPKRAQEGSREELPFGKEKLPAKTGD